MKKINVRDIKDAVAELCIKSNCVIDSKLLSNIKENMDKENSPVGQKILSQLIENSEVAKEKMMPICQDTGMAVVFCEVGQEVYIEGGLLTDAINEGVRKGYKEGYLRKSVVADPINRENTNDNTPAIIHYDIVKGDQIKITVAPKGFGSENMSQIHMLKPADGLEGITECIVKTVERAGGNACPPMVIGVGIGGTFEKAAMLSKKALLRELGEKSDVEHIKQLEDDLLNRINKLGIGPQGLGGNTTALAVNVESFATHIAGLPVAINISCHVNRHMVKYL